MNKKKEFQPRKVHQREVKQRKEQKEEKENTFQQSMEKLLEKYLREKEKENQTNLASIQYKLLFVFLIFLLL